MLISCTDLCMQLPMATQISVTGNTNYVAQGPQLPLGLLVNDVLPKHRLGASLMLRDISGKIQTGSRVIRSDAW